MGDKYTVPGTSVELSLTSTALNASTPQGAQLLSYGDIRFADGAVSSMYEAIFSASETVTKYAGESGRPSWQTGDPIDSRGLGSIADMSVAIANDAGFGTLVTTTAAAMTTANIRTLVAQAGAVRRMSRRTAAACNDNGAWRGATFCFAAGRAA